MSNHLTSEVDKRQVGSMARTAVMRLMADKASDDGSGIWASKQRMAEEIGTTRQTIITTIKSLIEDGLIGECGQRACENGYTVEYLINVQALRSLPLVPCHEKDHMEASTRKAALPVKQLYATRQAPLPHPSSSFTQTPLEPLKQTQGACAGLISDDWMPAELPVGSKGREVVDAFSAGEFAATVQHFRAHHRSKATQSADWQETWTAWVLNGHRMSAGRGRKRAARPAPAEIPSLTPAAREQRRAEAAAQRERQAKFEDAMAKLSRGESDQAEIDALPDYWKQVGETRGYLRRHANGTYGARVQGGLAA
ncbi:MAG: hypothetical protein J7530_08140 [Novosphingobium sp.]|nr:hypothetical protein [Novosphingobium sp.]